MRYLCICHYDQKKFDALTQADLEALGKECQPRDEQLRKSGHLVMVGSLALPNASRTLRPGRVAPAVSDGPYAETDEPFGAFFVVEAKDMTEAVRVASLHPSAHVGAYLGGGIEVRQIDFYDQP